MRAEIIDSAKGLDAPAWNGLAERAGTLYSGHDWISFGESVEPDLVARHIEVRDATGRLRAAVPAYVVHRPANAHYSADRLFADVEPGLDDSPHVLVGGSRGYNGALLVDPDDSELDRVVTAVLATLSDIEEGLGPDAWSLWTYLPTATAATLARRYGSVPRLVAGDCAIDWPDTGWPGYLDSLSSRRRKTIRRERAKFAASGLRVVHVPLSECLQEVGALMAQTQSRYGFDVSAQGMTDIMRTQGEAFHGAGSVLLCLDPSDRALGCAVFYDFGDTRYARAAGFDYDALPGVHEYFELCIYSAVEAASRKGLRRLHLGMSSYDAKSLRGARIWPRWMVTSSTATWGTTEAEASNRRAADEIVAQVPSLERALVPGDDSWVRGATEGEATAEVAAGLRR